RIDYHGDNYDENAYYAHPVGGLRIAKITESVLDNYLQKQPLNVKTYKYGLKSGGGDDNPIMGGGVIKHIVTDRDYCYESSKEWATTSGYYVKTWHAMPISNITFNNGSAVLYSFVQEDIEDKRTRQHAISKYYYDVPPHKYSDVLEYDNQYNPTKIVTGYWDLVNRQNANPNSRIIRKEINRPYDLYDALYPYSGFDTDYRHGHLIRVEHYKRNTLMSSVDYHYNNDIGRENQLQVWVYKPYCTVDYVATPLAEYNLTGDPNYPSNKVENSIYKNGSWQLDVFNWKALVSETHKQYFYRNGNRDTVETVKNYAYNNYAHTHPTDVTTANSNQTIADKYVYHENMVNTLLHHKRTVNNDSVVSEIVFAGNRPQKVRYKAGNTTVFNDKIVYDRYDHYGNIAEISTNEGKHTCYIWSYGNQHPVAEIDNITYPGLLQTLGQNETWIRELGNKYQPSEQDMNLLNNLRNQLTTSHVSTFTYKPLLGVSSITDASGFTTHYEQDNFGRLTETSIVENGQKKVLQTNEYHINDKMGILGAGFAVTSFNVEQGSLLNSGSEYVFRVYVVGGSGDFKYEWDLFWGEEWPDENYRMIHYEPQWDMNEITMTPNKPNTSISINRLKIWVTDNVTQDVKEFQTWFYVQ
ncbi:MAG: hypothetical protein LBJ72_15395, partial [Dysgonamonadaceae bacterium]|nr:hypothetical protein [Dysgonamonadaceae bacterium]